MSTNLLDKLTHRQLSADGYPEVLGGIIVKTMMAAKCMRGDLLKWRSRLIGGKTLEGEIPRELSG